jgi:hypothetical protein
MRASIIAEKKEKAKVMDHSNIQNWYLLFLGIGGGLLGFWQIRTGETQVKRFGSWGHKITRTNTPKIFWMTSGLFLGLSGICIVMAVTHWR